MVVPGIVKIGRYVMVGRGEVTFLFIPGLPNKSLRTGWDDFSVQEISPGSAGAKAVEWRCRHLLTADGLTRSSKTGCLVDVNDDVDPRETRSESTRTDEGCIRQTLPGPLGEAICS